LADRAPLAELAARLGNDRFVTEPAALAARLVRCRALVFDWDGVLGPGAKGPAAAGGFHEVDAMGLNLLRYGLWRRGGSGAVPPVAVVSGQHDPGARALAERDRLTALYMGFLDKRVALEHLCRTLGVEPREVLFVFDDVIDLGAAEQCGARFLVARAGQPLLEDFARRRGLCDYLVRAPAGAGAVREACEVALALLGIHEEVFQARGWLDESYRGYLEARAKLAPARRFRAERDGAAGAERVAEEPAPPREQPSS
jgi:3-deoxy-D-manno-octulosonate 8-phosphate phosphatase (KDO 8-P phosphatase)